MRLPALAAFCSLAGVVLGALGAHAFADRFATPADAHAWDTAVLYHLVHGVALLCVGVWRAVDGRAARSRLAGAAAWLWAAGIAGFSGSLYVLALGGPSWLGPVTPAGGLCLLAGWAALAAGALRLQSATKPA